MSPNYGKTPLYELPELGGGPMTDLTERLRAAAMRSPDDGELLAEAVAVLDEAMKLLRDARHGQKQSWWITRKDAHQADRIDAFLASLEDR